MSVENATSVNITDDVSLERIFDGSNGTRPRIRDGVIELGVEVFRDSEFPIVPAWVLIAYFVCVNAVGVILNVAICIGFVMKRNKKGIHTLILQIALSDLLSLTMVAVPELWSHEYGTWMFGSVVCRCYASFEVFAGTSSIYFLVILNLHALASSNLMRRISDKRSEGELSEDATEMRSSRHSLVAREEETSRPADPGGAKKPLIPVGLPLILVWILSAALSVPEAPLSTVIDSRSGVSMCTFVEGYHSTSMRFMLSIFQLLIPSFLLMSTSIVIAFRLCANKGRDESTRLLKTALFLCSLFFVLSVPRYALATIHGLCFGNKQNATGMDRFRFPPLNYDVTPISVPIALSFLHFLSPVIKPLGYIFFLRNPNKVSLGIRKRQRRSDQDQ